MSQGITPERIRGIERFLYDEARHLELNELERWLDLLADDIRYTMPVRESVQPGTPLPADGDTFAIFDDDKASLRMRVLRIRTGQAHAEIPPSVTQRLITNVMVDAGDTPGTFIVGSNFMVYQERRGLHAQTFFGHREDCLLARGSHFLIKRRTITLAQAVLPTTLSIFF